MAIKTLLSLGLALLFGGTVGCESAPGDIDPDGRGGEFTVSVTTTSTVQMSGLASSSGQDGVGWSAFLISDDLEGGMTILVEGMGRPEEGTYPIADFVTVFEGDTTREFGMTVNAPGDAHDLQSLSGTLTIVSSSPDWVTGRFSFSGSQGTTGVSGTVEGTFTTTNKDQ